MMAAKISGPHKLDGTIGPINVTMVMDTHQLKISKRRKGTIAKLKTH